MGVGRWISRRLTYANVAATVALFVSLGGASYAAFALPSNSVGTKQLQLGAVVTRALGFPLGVTGVTDTAVQDLVKGPCNAPHRPGEVVHALCPDLAQSNVRTPGREVQLRFRSPGRLVISAIVGLQNAGPPNTTASVAVHLLVDGRWAADDEVAVAGGQRVQVPEQLLARISAGPHTVGVAVAASYHSFEPGDVLVSPVSLIASALPAS